MFFSIAFSLYRPVEKKRSEYIPPPIVIKNLTFGLKYAFADSFWLRATQDFDYCEQKINEMDCKSKSWLFQTVNLATEIDPVFEPLMYRTAALALSVVISDYAGAEVIFDKAMNQYPNDWQIAYAAGYHALYDQKNKSKASKLYEIAGKNGAPEWVLVLAGRLAADDGDLTSSRKILEGMIATNQDEKIIKRLKQKIAQIEAESASKK